MTTGPEPTTSNDRVIDLRDDEVIDLREGVFYSVEGPDGPIGFYEDLRAVFCRPASPDVAARHLARMIAAADEPAPSDAPRPAPD